MTRVTFLKRITFISSFMLVSLLLTAQNKGSGFQYDSIKLNSGNNKNIDTTIQVALFKSDSALRNGKIIITLDKEKTFGFIKMPVIPDSSKYSVGILKDSVSFSTFRINAERDSADDRFLTFKVFAFDSTGAEKKLEHQNLLVIIKPYRTPLTSNSEFESWFFVGTNFDLFDGIKAQEFFFRSNTLIHIHRNSYIQAAIYKNRYFISDSTTNNFLFQNNTPILLRDSLYSYSKGYYQKKTSQTIDALGLQMDFLFKIKNFSTSSDELSKSFFVSAGFDASTNNFIIENNFSNFDTIMFRTAKPDSTFKGRLYPFPTAKYKYKTGIANFNIGAMYIYDTKNINFKGQFCLGMSVFNRIISLETKGGSAIFQSVKDLYVQFRTFGTYKPFGISFGLDVIKTSGDFLKVNATLSKVLDLDNFVKTFSPVNSLSIK